MVCRPQRYFPATWVLAWMTLWTFPSHAQSPIDIGEGPRLLLCRVNPEAERPWSSQGENSYAIGLPSRAQPDALTFRWGESIYNWEDLIWVDHSGEVDVYRREKDTDSFGPVHLEKMYYAFWRGLFYAHLVQTRGTSNWHELKEMIFEIFGEKVPTLQSQCPNEFYVWNGSRTSMVLDYCDSTGEGTLLFFSAELDKEMRDMAERK